MLLEGLCATCRSGRNGPTRPLKRCTRCHKARYGDQIKLREGLCGRCWRRTQPIMAARQREYWARFRAKHGRRPLWIALDLAGRPLGVYSRPERAERVSPWIREFRLDKVVTGGK